MNRVKISDKQMSSRMLRYNLRDLNKCPLQFIKSLHTFYNYIDLKFIIHCIYLPYGDLTENVLSFFSFWFIACMLCSLKHAKWMGLFIRVLFKFAANCFISFKNVVHNCILENFAILYKKTTKDKLNWQEFMNTHT